MAMFARKSEKAEALRQVSLFANLAKKDLALIASHVDEVDVPTGTTLARQGERGNQLSLIVTGEATVTRNNHLLATLGPGDTIGEMSLIDQADGTATVVTTAPSTLLVMSPRDFSSLLNTSPSFARKIMIELVGRLRDADRRLVG
jgi:CRP/FNR family transcriptional regulator, cyclic AMP receptor protein